MRHRLYYHIVWTTRDREPLIDLARAEFLLDYIPGIARQERGRVLEIGIVSTHLHLLVTLHPLAGIPRLLQRLKGGSVFALNRRPSGGLPPLRWADGYDIDTVGHRQIDVIRTYIRSQPQRHPTDAIAGLRIDSSRFETLR